MHAFSFPVHVSILSTCFSWFACAELTAAASPWQQLKNAAIERGAVVDDRVALEGSPRGLYTRKPVAAGELLISVPTSIMLRDSQRDKSHLPEGISRPLVTKYAGRDLSLLWLAGLVLGLRNTSQQDNLWKTYFDSLPSTEDSWSSAYFSDVQFNAFLVSQNKQLVELVQDVLGAVRRLNINGKIVSESEARWATHIALSRKLAVHLRSGESFRALMPVIDLANHAEEDVASVELVCKSSGSNGPGSSCALWSKRELASGEELRFTYTSVSNAAMLAIYGFQIPDTSIALALPGDLHSNELSQMLRELGCPKPYWQLGAIIFERAAPDGISDDMLNCLRLGHYVEKGMALQEIKARIQHIRNIAYMPFLDADLDQLFWIELGQGCADLRSVGTQEAYKALQQLHSGDGHSKELAISLEEEVEALRRCEEACSRQTKKREEL